MSRELIQKAFSTMLTEIKQAQRLTDQGELIKAEEIYHDMLNQQANCPPALYGLSELANKIDEQEVREDLLKRAIEELKGATDRNQIGVLAIWLAEQAESLIKVGRQDDAKKCIAESQRLIKQNLA